MLKALLILFFSFASVSVFSQNVTVYEENFNGLTHTFNLIGATAGLGSPESEYQHWVVNSAYAGGSGTYSCVITNVNYSVPNIPAQPIDVDGNPNSSYLHVLDKELEADGIDNAALLQYAPMCPVQDQVFVKMQDFVSTENLQDVTLSFHWICGGGPDTYGSVYYKTIGGNWTQITDPVSNYVDQTTWTQQSIQLPVFEGQEGIKFGFLFEHGFQIISNRGFGIDDVRISATDVTVGVQEGELLDAKLYPNPTTDVLNISGVEVQSYTIFNVLGEKLHEGSTKKIDVSDLKNGVYLLEVVAENGIAVKRFQKL